MRSNKSKSDLSIDILQAHKLNKYILTESILKLLQNLNLFSKKADQNVSVKSIKKNTHEGSSSKNTPDTENDVISNLTEEEKQQTEEYKEILNLRHLNMTK